VRQKSSVIKVDCSGSTLAVLSPSDRESTRQVFEALKENSTKSSDVER
jgi:hypothetical protein